MTNSLLRKSIAGEWGSFAAAVLPPDAPPDQIREMRRAFYGGFWAMLQVATNLGSIDPEPSDEAVALFLGRLLDEGREFQQRVEQGRA